ncbi:unnamed protein product, partial [Didymodactylos carnosus]
MKIVDETLIESTPPQRHISVSVQEKENLEILSLLWLDTNVNQTQHNLDIQTKLRSAINFLKTFNTIDECEKYIQQTKQAKITLIVSGDLGQMFVPKVHHLSQLNSIYIYCIDQVKNEQWSKMYSKINAVIDRSDILIEKVLYDQLRRRKIEDPIPLNIYNRSEQQTTEKSTTNLRKENSDFMWTQLL